MRERSISIAEPVSELRRIKIRECGEPLVDFLELCPDLRLSAPRFTYRRETLLRKSVAEALGRANEALMRQGMRIYVVEGWRPPHIQRRMYASSRRMFAEKFPEKSEAALTRLTNQYTAPMNTRVPPPHTTGGAVDVELTDLDGNPLDVRSPYEWRDHRGFALAATGLTDEARRNRDTLAGALAREGVTNYPSEYWHYSYGDQGWAYRGGHEAAIYAAITPEGWSPDPADDVEEPLQFVAAPQDA